LWFTAIVGLYAFYEISHEVWWCLRFIVPAMPALILAGLLGIEAIAARQAAPLRDRFRGWAALSIALWASGLSVFWTRHFAITETKNMEKTFSKACAAVRGQFPPNTLVATMSFSGAFYYYTDLAILRWDLIEAPDFARYAALAQKAGRPIVAVDYKWDETRALRERCPGTWTRAGQIGDAMIWRLEATTPSVIIK
jgi:hypothetical protein